MSILTFRLAHLEDADEVGEFMTRNFLTAYGHSARTENIARAVNDYYSPAAQRRALADPRRTTMLAERQGRLLGVAQLSGPLACPAFALPQPSWSISLFYVEPDEHGSGLAATLMQALLAQALELGAASLWLSVWQHSGRAIRFYEKEGFSKVGSLQFALGEELADDWAMARAI